MSEYIINPWFFYFVNVVANIEFICSVLVLTISVACIVFFILGFAGYMASKEYGENDEGFKAAKDILNTVKMLAILLLVLAIVTSFIPTKDTMYKMAAAKMATYENIEQGGEFVREMFDYAVDKIAEMNTEQED